MNGEEMEPQNIDNQRIQFLHDIAPLVEQRVQRPIDSTETRAIGFVVDRQWDAEKKTDVFLSEDLGGAEGIDPRQAAMNIHNAIYQAKKAKLQKEMQAASNNRSLKDDLAGLEKVVDLEHQMAEKSFQSGDPRVFLGGVPGYWLSPWIDEYTKRNLLQ